MLLPIASLFDELILEEVQYNMKRMKIDNINLVYLSYLLSFSILFLLKVNYQSIS